MKTRYLCPHHVNEICCYPTRAEQIWNSLIAHGLTAQRAQNTRRAGQCFGGAYETALLQLDRHLPRTQDTDILHRLLLSVQHLATALVSQDERQQAAQLINQLHDKLIFLARDEQTDPILRATLISCQLPHLERLLCEVLSNSSAEVLTELIRKSEGVFWRDVSTACH